MTVWIDSDRLSVQVGIEKRNIERVWVSIIRML
jgi:hypothetical protein